MEVAGENGPEVQAGKSGKELDNKRERILSVQKKVTPLRPPLFL
jgi:hypothetical protein